MKILIEPIFSTPLALLQLPNMEEINEKLAKLMLDIKFSGVINSTPTPTNKHNIYDSEMNFFDLKNDEVQYLKKSIYDVLIKVVSNLNGYEKNVLEKFNIVSDSWFHITENGGYISSHIHPMASWSGVYYVDDGNPDENYPDNGVIRFLDTRVGTNMFLDAGNFKLSKPFNSGSYVVVPKPGLLVIFPSYLGHEVASFYGSRKRFSVAFNVWFDKKQ